MTVEIGRLAFTRRNGESFQVGEDTLVTVYRRSNDREAKVEIIRADRTRQELRVKQQEPFYVHPEVEVRLTFDHGRGGTKVLVTAPKNIRIMRSELVNASPKKDEAHTV